VHSDVQGILSSRGGMGETETLKRFAKKDSEKSNDKKRSMKNEN
jgi:hypothetical protein